MREPEVIMVRIHGAPEVDNAELYDLTLNLRAELLQLDVERAELADSGEAPSGTRAASDWTEGILALSAICSSRTLRDIVDLVKSWMARNAARTVKLELNGDVIKITGASQRAEDKLVESWIDLHSQELPDESGL